MLDEHLAAQLSHALAHSPVSSMDLLNATAEGPSTLPSDDADRPGGPLNLGKIRNVLQRLEDSIIFSLIERAQFAHNPRIYQRDAFAEVLHKDGFDGSWVEWFLLQTETMHAKVRRYDRCVRARRD